MNDLALGFVIGVVSGFGIYVAGLSHGIYLTNKNFREWMSLPGEEKEEK